MQYFEKKWVAVLAVVMVVSAISGCDFINSFLNSNKDSKKTSTGTAEPATRPSSAKASAPAGDVLAQVGSWTLTTDQFNQRLKLLKEGLPNFDESKASNKEAVLNELVRQQLLVKDAEEAGIGAQKEIAEAVEDFRRTLLVQELANRLTKNVAATEKEAQVYFDKNKQMFVDPIQWKVSEIVVEDETAAKNILVQVLQGGSFADIAKAQYKGKSAAAGGALKPFDNGKAPFAAMQSAISSLDAGGTSPVFKGPQGYYIVHVDDKRGGAAKAFKDIKDDLIAGLTLRKQQEAILAHIEQLS